MLPYPMPLMHALPITPANFRARDGHSADEDRVHVRFWLKPHLRDFVTTIAGDKPFEMQSTNVIGSIALSCMTPKNTDADRASVGFDKGRDPVEGRITKHVASSHGFIQVRKQVDGLMSLRSGERYGYLVASLSRFESLVEHLFHHMLLVHVDACMTMGDTQNNAIRTFLDRYNIDTQGIEFDSLKRTVSRRRSKMRVVKVA